MKYETAVCMDIGAREEQQDRVLALRDGGALLLALADGMGGHEGGALAAQTVMDVAGELFAERSGGATADLLTSIALTAHERINAAGVERGVSPHSTCVLLHLTGGRAAWVHVGDSRLYRFENGRMAGRTTDHSMVELLRLQGRISEEEMKRHADRNIVLEALGGEEQPEVDTGGQAVGAAHGFLLASDGLWENAEDADLEGVFDGADLEAAVRGLVKEARRRGGPACDNISVAVARARRAPRWLPGSLRRGVRARFRRTLP